MSVANTIIGYTVDGDNVRFAMPYRVAVRLRGSAPILFHRWDCEDVEAKAQAAKGSAMKKTDNVEAYLYRTEEGEIAIPATYLHQALVNAAKYKQDPRSPRKSMSDMAKAAFIVTPWLASTGKREPDFLDRRRVLIQRAGVTRVRPALLPGWEVEFQIETLLPEYISPELLYDLLAQAGRLVGIGDYRPMFGRFQVVEYKVLEDDVG
ncbi:hypothetical protein [Alicyclobacillus sendaiensis]|uniref:Uncharacterized protein n=1 Tax=Alicyclobacillus sendaiensis PA2 TaxID=3029425 RepID=A0ABT6Y1T5_ALISE|nr:hypothetical protein [Alicyclobacillus sendaiensis]MDI9261290.1 hypothetical protein [Alicyclobacillus sendaiensis PA2]